MGMFDYVEHEEKCPHCKQILRDFQSKDGPCIMTTLDFWDVNNFYERCGKCLTWIEYTLKKRPNRKLTLKDYEKEVKVGTKKELKQREKLYKELGIKLPRSN